MERSGHPRPPRSGTVVAYAGIGIALLLAALVIASVSISGSSDSPCGSIVDDRADWVTESSCGIAHRGQLVVVLALGAAGVAACRSAARVSRRGGGRELVAVLFGAFVVGVIGTTALVWRAATYDEPVLKLGWVAVRDLSAWSTIGLGIAIVVAVVCVTGQGRTRAGQSA